MCCPLICKMGWLAAKEREGAILWYGVLSRVRLSGLPQSPLHTAGLTAAQYGKNLMPPGTQPIWMLRLPLSQAQVVQKNCSGLIPKALQIHTAGISACSLLGGGTLKKKKKKEKSGAFFGCFYKRWDGPFHWSFAFCGAEGGGSPILLIQLKMVL